MVMVVIRLIPGIQVSSAPDHCVPAAEAGTLQPLVAAVIGPHRHARTRASLQLAGQLLSVYPRIALSSQELFGLNSRLADLVRDSRQRERAALLALCAVLADHLSAEVRFALRTLGEPEPEPDQEPDRAGVCLAVAAHVCTLLADGFPLSDQLLVDLAAMVRSDEAARVIVDRGPNRYRAMNLVLAAAHG